MAEEQTPQGVQDPVQTPAAPPAAPPAPVQPQAPQVGPGPWAEQLQQSFDPETAARVDAFLRSSVQPHVTRLEQQYAQTEGARQMLDAFQRDPDAANVAVNRELYGDVYADQLAASLGRTDLLVGQQPAQQQPAQQATEPQQGWREDPVYQAMAERIQQEQYDSAKQQFLSDPQYADINADLFDPFVAGAETWEDAVNAYRSYAAQFAQNAPAAEVQQQVAPPTLGSEAGGAPGSTPSYPKETLDEAIDAIFSENKPIAPPVMGQ